MGFRVRDMASAGGWDKETEMMEGGGEVQNEGRKEGGGRRGNRALTGSAGGAMSLAELGTALRETAGDCAAAGAAAPPAPPLVADAGMANEKRGATTCSLS